MSVVSIPHVALPSFARLTWSIQSMPDPQARIRSSMISVAEPCAPANWPGFCGSGVVVLSIRLGYLRIALKVIFV